MSVKAVCKVFFSFCLLLLFVAVTSAKKYKLSEIELPENLDDFKVFTDEDIAKFDGSNPDLPLYMGVRGVVFDVSSGEGFYGKGRSYNALIGKDASRAVAKMSLEPADLISDISNLDDGFLESLDQVYKSTYLPKYPIVGYMDYLVEEKLAKSSRDDL